MSKAYRATIVQKSFAHVYFEAENETDARKIAENMLCNADFEDIRDAYGRALEHEGDLLYGDTRCDEHEVGDIDEIDVAPGADKTSKADNGLADLLAVVADCKRLRATLEKFIDNIETAEADNPNIMSVNPYVSQAGRVINELDDLQTDCEEILE